MAKFDIYELDGLKIMIANKVYTVEIKKDKYSVATGNNGEIKYIDRKIFLAEYLKDDPYTLLEILIHEIQHGITERYMLAKFKDKEEDFTTIQAMAMAKLFIDNPNLIKIFGCILTKTSLLEKFPLTN